MTRLTDLSQPEVDVLSLLVQARVTASAVTLAADLWRTTDDWKAMDPYPLVTYILDSLASRGLVRYTLDMKDFGRDLPTSIRLTPSGWALMGYPNRSVEVGTAQRSHRDSLHPGDMTDYLNLAGHTYGGPIETDTFGEHRRDYPHHDHMYGVQLTMANQSTARKPKRVLTRLAEPDIQHEGSDMTRVYLRVTPAMEAAVISAREGMGAVAYSDIAQETGLPERTVKYILTDLPRLRRGKAGEANAAKSLKERVFDYVEAIGTIKDVAELRRILGMGDDEHSVMHVLHSLHTQGRIDFDERGNGMGTATVVNIRLHKKSQKVRLSPDPEAVVEIAEPNSPLPVISREQEERAISEAHSKQEPEGFPLLDLLLQREKHRLDGDSKGMAYVVAAEAIQAFDPDEARRLMQKSKEYDVPFPSPIEAEYLRYVAAHSGVSAEPDGR